MQTLSHMTTRHSPSCTMSFGRPDCSGSCPRCNELRAGAAPRKGWGAAKRSREAATLAAIRAHGFGNCKKCPRGMCVCFDW